MLFHVCIFPSAAGRRNHVLKHHKRRHGEQAGRQVHQVGEHAHVCPTSCRRRRLLHSVHYEPEQVCVYKVCDLLSGWVIGFQGIGGRCLQMLLFRHYCHWR